MAADAQATQETGSEELRQAYEMVRQGKPMEALTAVLSLLRNRFGGDERRVFQTIAEAKRAHEEQSELEALAASLQSLSLQHKELAERLTEMHNSSILAESGREAVLCDAGNDGSSRVCPVCGALVASRRFEQHAQFWCTNSSSMMADDDDDALSPPSAPHE